MKVFKAAVAITLRHPLYLLVYAVVLSLLGVLMASSLSFGEGDDAPFAAYRAKFSVIDRDGSGPFPGTGGLPGRARDRDAAGRRRDRPAGRRGERKRLVRPHRAGRVRAGGPRRRARRRRRAHARDGIQLLVARRQSSGSEGQRVRGACPCLCGARPRRIVGRRRRACGRRDGRVGTGGHRAARQRIGKRAALRVLFQLGHLHAVRLHRRVRGIAHGHAQPHRPQTAQPRVSPADDRIQPAGRSCSACGDHGSVAVDRGAGVSSRSAKPRRRSAPRGLRSCWRCRSRSPPSRCRRDTCSGRWGRARRSATLSATSRAWRCRSWAAYGCPSTRWIPPCRRSDAFRPLSGTPTRCRRRPRSRLPRPKRSRRSSATWACSCCSRSLSSPSRSWRAGCACKAPTPAAMRLRRACGGSARARGERKAGEPDAGRQDASAAGADERPPAPAAFVGGRTFQRLRRRRRIEKADRRSADAGTSLHQRKHWQPNGEAPAIVVAGFRAEASCANRRSPIDRKKTGRRMREDRLGAPQVHSAQEAPSSQRERHPANSNPSLAAAGTYADGHGLRKRIYRFAHGDTCRQARLSMTSSEAAKRTRGAGARERASPMRARDFDAETEGGS